MIALRDRSKSTRLLDPSVYEMIARLKNFSNRRSADGLVYMVPVDNIVMEVNSSLFEGVHLC